MSGRRSTLPAVVVAMVVAGALLNPGRADAEAFPGVFRALATASGVRITYVVPKGSVSDTIADAGAPATGAFVDSLGESRAFASFPYPGDLLSNAPGLLRGAAGIPAPEYPFYVSSFFPSRSEQQAGLGPYRITARSSESASRATADIGYFDQAVGSVGAFRAETLVQQQSGGVTAEGSDDTTSLSIGPLRIARVASSARVTMAADGTLTRAADTRVDGVVVGEHSAALTTKGLVLSEEPGPAQLPAPPADALAQAGISVSLTSATELPDGILAGALRITYAQPDGTYLLYEVGGARASVTGTGTAAETSETDTAGADGASAGESVAATEPQDGNASPPPAPLGDGPSAPATDLFQAAHPSSPVLRSGPFPTAAATVPAPYPERPLRRTSPGSAEEATAGSRSAPPGRVGARGTVTRLGLVRQLSAGPDVAPLFGGAVVLVLAGGALVLAAARRARMS